MGVMKKLFGGPKRQGASTTITQDRPDPKLEAIRRAKERRLEARRSTGRGGFRTDLTEGTVGGAGVNIAR